MNIFAECEWKKKAKNEATHEELVKSRPKRNAKNNNNNNNEKKRSKKQKTQKNDERYEMEKEFIKKG